MPITVTITGQHAVDAKFDKLKKGLDDWEPILSKSANKYYSHVQSIFVSEGGKGGVAKWAPLSPLREAKRERLVGKARKSHPILNTYGGLRAAATTNAFTQRTGVTGAQHYTPTSVTLLLEGDKVRNNFGFPNDKKGYDRVPKREFWPFSDIQRDIVFQPFERWADDWLGK
jgi:hypothetical protein